MVTTLKCLYSYMVLPEFHIAPFFQTPIKKSRQIFILQTEWKNLTKKNNYIYSNPSDCAFLLRPFSLMTFRANRVLTSEVKLICEIGGTSGYR